MMEKHVSLLKLPEKTVNSDWAAATVCKSIVVDNCEKKIYHSTA